MKTGCFSAFKGVGGPRKSKSADIPLGQVFSEKDPGGAKADDTQGNGDGSRQIQIRQQEYQGHKDGGSSRVGENQSQVAFFFPQNVYAGDDDRAGQKRNHRGQQQEDKNIFHVPVSGNRRDSQTDEAAHGHSRGAQQQEQEIFAAHGFPAGHRKDGAELEPSGVFVHVNGTGYHDAQHNGGHNAHHPGRGEQAAAFSRGRLTSNPP